MTDALGAGEHFTSAFSAPLNTILYIHKGMYNRILYVYKESEVVKKVTELKVTSRKNPCSKFFRCAKGSCHLRFSGIRPLRGGGVPPFSAKEKNLLFFTLIFR